jgi:hypothetical protein
MKRTIIGSLVGGLLIFVWQTASWAVLDLHRSSQQYTPKQDTIINFLSTVLDKEGGYLIPTVPQGTSMEEAEKIGKTMLGKPWASIQYHQSFNFDNGKMMMNMVRGLLANIIMVWLVCWMIGKMKVPLSFVQIFLVCLFIGLIAFINEPYTGHIWYPLFDVNIYLVDALVSWGLCGVWLGWWMRK